MHCFSFLANGPMYFINTYVDELCNLEEVKSNDLKTWDKQQLCLATEHSIGSMSNDSDGRH
jgi:hypothetical protein